MPASILFGKSFEQIRDDDGVVRDVVPVDGAYEFVGRVKLQDAIALCESHGIPSTIWPIYDVGVTARVPLKEAVAACKELAPMLLGNREEEFVRSNAFLVLVVSHLAEGQSFFIVM